MVLPKLHDRAVRDSRSRPLHLRILVRTPRRAKTDSVADSVVINIQRSSERGKLCFVLTRDASFQIRVPRVCLQVTIEVVQAWQHVEVLVAGSGGERLGELRRAGERLRRRAAFQFCAEELLEQRAEVNFGACGEWREEDVQAGWEAGDERCWDGVVDGGGPADVQFVALFQGSCDLGRWLFVTFFERNEDMRYDMHTSAGKSSKPNVKRFSSAALRALLKTRVSGLTWMPLGSMPVPSGCMNVMRCFIVLWSCVII